MEAKDQIELPRTLSIELQGKNFTINFPSMGKIIDIETNKIAFSGGKYAALIKAGIISANIATDLIETAATLIVLVPEFEKTFKLDSIFELNPIETLDFVKVYKEKVEPWYTGWLLKLKIEPKIPEISSSNAE